MIFQLHCGSQSYDWGKLGDESLVAQFVEAVDSNTTDKNTPYAELWMGSHPKLPSKPLDAGYDSLDLRGIIDRHPEVLGKKVCDQFGKGELPYLFKVLSIRKALSIQAHPDKALGKVLHERDPKNYPDPNHKPEMAIALTDFEGFCGFRPLAEIAGFLDTVPEFVELVTSKVAEEFKSRKDSDPKGALKHLFTAVMTARDNTVTDLTPKLAARAAKEGVSFAGGESAGAGKPLADLLVRVDKQFPHDIGLFCGGLMLNYVQLQKGEAMFLRAKDPHAYISGDIIECMAASDNVVRAGFTPKFKDVPTLVDMLTYSCAPVSEQKMVPKPFSQISGGETKLFDPPIDEFAVVQQRTKAGESVHLAKLTGPTVLLITEGNGIIRSEDKEIPYKRGYVFFVGAGTELDIEAKEDTAAYCAVAEL